MRYRKKPVEIDALLWTGYNIDELLEFYPEAVYSTTPTEENYYGPIVITTLEGNMLCHPNNYIIKGVKGEYYPCKADIFLETYEKV